MQTYPIVSIIGRPNVGKSSLFNRILQRRIAVVDDMSGVTRDRNYKETTWNGQTFMLVDTGGLVPDADESMHTAINSQVESALKESMVVVFLVDGQNGPTDLDLRVAKVLRKEWRDKVVLAVNKAESTTIRHEASEFLNLGCGDPIAVSALHGTGVGDLLDRIVEKLTDVLKKNREIPNIQETLSIAIVGRPNAGKSSLVNKLLNTERMIVDETPGTTRDAIDSYLSYDDKIIKIIDTAGLRRKSQVKDDVEYYANLRALQGLQRCTICCLLIDAVAGLGEQDLKILAHAVKNRKGIFLCWNKWDIKEKDHKTFDHLVAEHRSTYMELHNVPVLSISALTGQRVNKVLEYAISIHETMRKWLKPSEVKDFFFQITRAHPHPFNPGRAVRFLGIKQQKTEFPLFQIFCTNPKHVALQYKRFLTNKFQEQFGFSGCPVVFQFASATATNEAGDRSNTDVPESDE